MGAFEQWLQDLRLPFMGEKARAILGALGKSAGDANRTRAVKALNEHHPTLAQDPQSVALIASERQIDANPKKSSAVLAVRLPPWLQTWRRAGAAAGLLLALDGAGFTGAVILQTTGLAFSLHDPGEFVPVGTTKVVLEERSDFVLWVNTTTALNPEIHGNMPLPPGLEPWFTFDAYGTDANDDQFNSRFAIVFLGDPLPDIMVTWARATFTASDTGTWTWNNPFSGSTYLIMPGLPVITDGEGPVTISADGSTRTPTTCIARASGPFTGYVDALAFEAGENPFGHLHAADLDRLRSIVERWKPAKATCVGKGLPGIALIIEGAVWGWPIELWDDDGLWGASVVTYTL